MSKQLTTPVDSNYEDWGKNLANGGKPRVGPGFPTWIVKPDEDGDVIIICPKVRHRCGQAAIVNERIWREGTADYRPKVRSRTCPYCAYTALIPEKATYEN